VWAATILAVLTAAAGALAGNVLGASQAGVRIAFTNNKAIWVIGAEGSGLRRVTKGTGSDGGIAWSNDAGQLAFTRFFGDKGCGEDQTRGDLYLIGADGKGERRLTNTGCMFDPPGNPAFAPKGRTLAFVDDKGIPLSKPPGWKPRVVLGHGLFPSWAPDARRLVESNGPVIEILDTATGNTRSIGRGDFAAWSHNGTSIAYVAGRTILVVHPAGGPIRRLVATPNTIDSIAWSPGDDRIAYSTSVGDKSATSWEVSLADGKRVKLGAGSFPAWDPDGTMLSLESNNWLYLVRADGSNRRKLTKGFGAAWSPGL
jgi:Tol biopolymer transport system component